MQFFYLVVFGIGLESSFIFHVSSLSCALIPLHLYRVSIMLHLMLSMSGSSVSFMPNRAEPFPRTTKKFHVNSLFLVLYLHSAHCQLWNNCIIVCSYNNTLVFDLVWFNGPIVELGNKISNTLTCIRLPSLPVAILYAILHIYTYYWFLVLQ